MQKLKRAIKLVIFLLLLYTMLRLLFYQLYFSRSNMRFADLTNAFYWGFRMDISAIFYVNFVFFAYFFLIHDILVPRYRKLLAVVLFTGFNLPFLAINCIDLAYYQFNLRRSTADLIGVIGGSLPAIGAFLKTWWWVFLFFIVLSGALVWFFRLVERDNKPSTASYMRSNFIPCLVFLASLGLLARGFSERPIIPSTPLLYLPAQYQPLASNSTINFLYSAIKHNTHLNEKKYFTGAVMDSLFTANQQLHPVAPFTPMNVVVFVMESFAKEYTDKNDPLHAQTPFLDSIMAESIVCSNAYSNGLESNKGLVAILGSIPPFFDEPFYYSGYSNNNIRGIGTLLKEEGYTTSFFMGAGYDHFGFARFAKLVGIDDYYSMQDYGDNRHYDGNWGIYDHYFLPFAARMLQKKSKPFFSTIFNISTHFPYKLPDTLQQQFAIKGQRAEQNSVSYFDYSLKLFFDIIKNEPWYKNTIFVFSADHNLFWNVQARTNLYKTFRIPIFFYLPGQKEHKIINKTVQQLDIVPTILDLLHYNRPFMAFGKSIFDTLSPGIAINHIGDLYQAIDSSYLFGYNEKTERPAYLYQFTKDTALQNDLLQHGELPDLHSKQLQDHLKAVIQFFNYSMMHNKLYVK